MVPLKYADLGFDIAGFGAKSKALRFAEKPIFVFNSGAQMDAEFITHICDSYLKICGKRKEAVCIRL